MSTWAVNIKSVQSHPPNTKARVYCMVYITAMTDVTVKTVTPVIAVMFHLEP
jgi:hypothetical protein